MHRILIVEDDRGISEAIKEQAEMWGLEAQIVQNFRDVMAEFAACDPHLVLLDISLPFLTDITGAVKSAECRKYRLFLFPPLRII